MRAVWSYRYLNREIQRKSYMAYCRVKSDTGIRFCVEFYPYNLLGVLRGHQHIAHAERRDTVLELLKLLLSLKPTVWGCVRSKLLGRERGGYMRSWGNSALPDPPMQPDLRADCFIDEQS